MRLNKRTWKARQPYRSQNPTSARCKRTTRQRWVHKRPTIKPNTIATMKKNVTPELRAIQRRFFDVLDILIDTGQISGLKGFCDMSGLNRAKYSNIRSEMGKPESERKETNYKVIDIEALSYICRVFNVNSEWLLLGRGKMFSSSCSSKEA